MKVFFHTLGCKVNQYETEYMRLSLNSAGYENTAEPDKADIVIVNSCTVTGESDRKTGQLVRKYRRLNKEGVIVLTGCMPQAFPTKAEELPADIILGNGSGRNIVSVLERFFQTGQRIVDVPKHKKGEEFEKCSIDTFSERTRAYMKIEDGCDRGCTYCIIPKARGRVRSRSLEDIKGEASALGLAGFKEIILVGINLSSYGKDIGLTLADAVEAVAKADGVERIRLGSLEPDLTDEPLLERLKQIPEFCPQFHLSLQSGCDETLKRMNRLYSSEEYKKIVKAIRSRWENAGITTDIMVGFVGETDEEFLSSLKFAEEIGFVKAHIFPYSVREGTAAAAMTGKVDGKIKNQRAALMAERLNKKSLEIFADQKGKIFSVLFETKEDDYILGYGENYMPVYVKAEADNLHTVKNVKITGVYKDGAMGEII